MIRNRHLPLYDKGGVSGLLYAIYLDADLGDPQRTMLEILRTSFAEFDAVQDRLAIGYTAGDLARIMDGGRTAVLLGLEGLDGLGTEPGLASHALSPGLPPRHAHLEHGQRLCRRLGPRGARRRPDGTLAPRRCASWSASGCSWTSPTPVKRRSGTS